MSGGTDRREDEHVPQFYGRIDEKFAEWETDVRLWQAEFKLEDRDRLGPRLHRRGLHRQPKIIVKTKLRTQDVAQFTVDNIIQCLKDNGNGELPEELGQEALDNYFDMRQGKAESIEDYFFREEVLTDALQKDTAIYLDEKICSSPSSWMDGVFRAVRWVMRGFDAADSERSVRPESPTSPLSASLHSHAQQNQREGWEGQRQNHTLPKGSVNHGQAASG